MTKIRKFPYASFCIGAMGLALVGCASDAGRHRAVEAAYGQQFNTFGHAVRQNIVAQIADPDPAWKNAPPPNADGKRIGERMTVYTVPSNVQNGHPGAVKGN